MNAVPFSIRNVFAGLGECHGLARQDGKFLVLEFQVQDSVLHVLKSGVKSLEIPLSDVAQITLRRCWLGFSNSLEIQLSRMAFADQIPGMKQGRLVLSLARRDVPAAQTLAQGIEGAPPKE